MPSDNPSHQAGDADLVDHLGQLAGAHRTHQGDRPGIAPDRGLDTGEIVGFTADHHRQCAVLRAGLAAGHRGVEKSQATLARGGVELARDLGRSGGVVDERGALAHALERALLAEGDGAQIVVVADTGKHHLGAHRRAGRGIGAAAGKVRQPLLGARTGPVVHGDVVAAASQVRGHVIAHHSQAHECDPSSARCVLTHHRTPVRVVD